MAWPSNERDHFIMQGNRGKKERFWHFSLMSKTGQNKSWSHFRSCCAWQLRCQVTCWSTWLGFQSQLNSVNADRDGLSSWVLVTHMGGMDWGEWISRWKSSLSSFFLWLDFQIFFLSVLYKRIHTWHGPLRWTFSLRHNILEIHIAVGLYQRCVPLYHWVLLQVKFVLGKYWGNPNQQGPVGWLV